MPTAQVFGIRQTADQRGDLVTKLDVPLPLAVLSGNTAWALVGYGTTARTVTVTDDQGNTYTKRSDVTRSDRLQLWACANVTNAPTRIIVNVNSTGSSYLCCVAGQMCGVGAFDVQSTGSSGGTTTPATGSLTPANGALILSGCKLDDSATFLSQWTNGTGYQSIASDLMFTFQYVQWKLHTTGVTTPSCTISASRGCESVVASFVADAAQGTAPPSIGFIDAWLDSSFPAPTGSASNWVIQAPVTPQTSHIMELFEVAPGVDPTGITDTGGNTYNSKGSISGPGGGGSNEIWASDLVIGGGSTNKLTITRTGIPADNFLTTLRIVGSPPSLITDTPTSGNGTDTTGTTTLGISTTPGAASGILIGIFGQESNTSLSVNSGRFMSVLSTPTIASPAPLMQNNGYRILDITSLTANQATWTTDAAPGDWQELNVRINTVAPAGGSHIDGGGLVKGSLIRGGRLIA